MANRRRNYYGRTNRRGGKSWRKRGNSRKQYERRILGLASDLAKVEKGISNPDSKVHAVYTRSKQKPQYEPKKSLY